MYKKIDDEGVRLRWSAGNEETKNIFNESQRGGNKYHSNFTLPSYSAILVLGLGFLFFGLAYFLHNRLPSPLSIKDLQTHPNQFIAERALNHLRQLSSLGSKPVGSYENEVLAVEYLTREIKYIMQQKNPEQRIAFDIQKCTGSYYLGFLPHGCVNYYSQVQNIVVKLGSDNSSSSLLINCHFDSVPTSPGASDDGLNCAVMLEILEVLSRSNKTLKHNVIFLFNGAEESALQASHCFITKHKWAHEVRAFINLEACGAGGRELLFQAGPNHPWLVKLYGNSVPYPHGQVLAEEIFQSGLVPSDTDFRVFRDFGKIPGLDFAHAMNGYVYHTSYDSLHAIPTGTFQHTGENLIALTKKIASSDILNNIDDYAAGRSIFFDVMGLFLIRYSELLGIIINIITALLSLITIAMNVQTVKSGLVRMQIWKILLLGFSVPFLGWLLAVIVVFITAFILDLCNSSMSWFTRPWLILCLYYMPVLVCCMAFPVIFNIYYNKQYHLKLGLLGQLFANGVQFILTMILLMGTILGIRSTYIIMIAVLFPTLSSLITSLPQWKKNTQIWLSAYAISTLPFTLLMMYQALTAFGLFVPITGRIGSSKNPEFIIGIFAALLCILSSCYLTQFIILLRQPRKTLAVLSGVYLLAVLAVTMTPLGFPYSSNPSAPTPQRIHIYHTDRVFHDISGHIRFQDSGYWLVNLDRHSPGSVQSVIPEIEFAQPVKSMCENELACGLPLFSPRVLQISEHSHWIPAPPPPAMHVPTNLELLSDDKLSESVRRLNFSVGGPDRMAIIFSPSVSLLGWSFDKEVNETGYKWQNKSVYYISYVQGLKGPPFQFWIDLQVTSESQTSLLDIAVVGHYINNGELSEQFKTLLRKYPDWAHVTAWTATYKSWTF